jgi:hypothetical protein
MSMGTTSRGTLVLRCLLLAALVPSTWPNAFGHDLPAPFELPRLAEIALVVLLLLTTLRRGARWPMSRWRGIATGLRWPAFVAAVAVAVDRIVGLRATAFYSAQTIADVMVVLLAVHLLGAVAGHVAVRGKAPGTDLGALRETVDAAAAAARRWRRPRLPRASADLAERLDAIVAGLVVAFWTLASFAMYEVAGVLLLVGGVLALLTIPVRLAAAWQEQGEGPRIRARRYRSLTRWRRRDASV